MPKRSPTPEQVRPDVGADQLLTPREVAALLKVSKPTLYAYMRQGKFPQQVHLLGSSRLPRWRAADVQAFIDSQEVRIAA